ncbi:MAG: type III pantothenate kinase [Pseudomonadota bacterium]
MFRGRERLGQWRMSTRHDRTADEYAAALSQLMGLKGIDYLEVGAIIISSVVPLAVTPLRWMSRDFFHCDAYVVREDFDPPIQIKINNSQEVGSDRVVNAVAARLRYDLPLIIIDFGTATTFDVVDEDGAYCGGAIAPGINLSLEALTQAAASLPRIAVEAPDSVIGRSTVDAMRSGIYWGYVSLIEGLIDRIEREYGKTMTVVGTGGLATLFAENCPKMGRVDNDLTMDGLLEIYELNRDLLSGMTH